jgi:hypothetical protein
VVVVGDSEVLEVEITTMMSMVDLVVEVEVEVEVEVTLLRYVEQLLYEVIK